AGKGVLVPSSDDETLVAIRELRAPFVLEQRLHGPECSLLALCDGRRAIALPLAQDHKRIGESDTGPNTGGMGAYAPAPLNADPDELLAMFVQPMLDHLAIAATPYVGVLFAGLMLTPDGPRLIEYNCRLGDPEAQAVLPLMDDDLAELALAATSAGFGDRRLTVRPGAACTVVVAALGYPATPTTGAAVTIDDAYFAANDDALLFPAGLSDGHVTGGRVLAVTGLGADLGAARRRAYEGVERVGFDGMQFRRDIAWRAPGATVASYATTGVDIDEGSRAVTLMRNAVERTHGAEVVSGLGSFGGAFSAKSLLSMSDPVLVASTDGVGTKVELAARLGRLRGVGHDIVNHCVNDVLVQAATPLFFLDYVASARLDAALMAEVVTGMAEACEAAGCALLGGETAEMPGIYVEGAFDVAGTLVGAVDRHRMLPRSDVAVGDLLIGVSSSGPHTNGYSLLRRLFDWIPYDVTPAGFGRSLGETLLEPHRNYLPVLETALAGEAVKALAHITGGGLVENLPRVLPNDIAATVDIDSWPTSPLFALVRELAVTMERDELYRTLNMGIGMVVVCAPDDAGTLQAAIPEPTWLIGQLSPRQHTVAAQVILH
ncbi:MAG: phosphoribosylformylglycinamidine cyclo-ligase, partial [Actinomycetota bacterium]|nr:phosphoribosylformylglycinamidine cyclo-ligase [Actinomycetota bacterium]